MQPEQDDAVEGKERRPARLAAVQALYQMDLTQRDLAVVLAEFLEHRFHAPDIDAYTGADRAFFIEIVTGTVKTQEAIDTAIASHLAQGWRLSRVDSILRAILRAGVYEITARHDIPARASINEYMEISHDFFGGDEPAVVNGVLDRIARETRKREFAKPKAKGPS